MNPVVLSLAGNLDNQDRAVVLDDDSRTVFCVADGAGGLSGGSEAATLAIEFLRKHVGTLKDPRSCVKLLEDMDQLICRDKVAGETTCAIAVISAAHVFGASVGDSGVWLIHQS